MRGSTPSLGRTRSSSNARPNHIPMPVNSNGNNGASGGGGFFSRSSGPGTPTSPNGLPPPFGSNSNPNPNPNMPTTNNNGDAPLASPSSPRNSFLPSFMQRSRPRSSTLTRLGSYQNSNKMEQGVAGSANPGANNAGSNGNGGGSGSGSRPSSGRAGSVNDLGRTRSQPLAMNTAGDPSSTSTSNSNPEPESTHRIRLVPHLETYRSVHFEPVVRDLKMCDDADNTTGRGSVLKIGRFTERAPGQAQGQGQGQQNQEASNNGGTGTIGQSETTSTIVSGAWNGAGAGGDVTAPSARDVGGDYGAQGRSTTVVPPQGNSSATATGTTGAGGGGVLRSNKVAFRSKVVSRAHAEIWVEAGGQFFIRDTHSSSGTFLNHIRLSSPTHESRPFSINDGDIIQLGVDYQGGTEEMYRCIKMKVEVGREKRGQDNFSKEAMKQLKALGGVPDTPTTASTPNGKGKTVAKASVTDCCICLFSVTVQQALFIAPCSHVFHYKCIRPILQVHHPGFSCPLCRTFHDLDADVELEDAWEVASRRASVATGRRESQAEGANGDSVSLAPAIPVISAPEDTSIASSNGKEVLMTDNSALNDLPPSPASGRPTMSLGALPIPSLGGPTSNGNPDYAGLDAATPMNHTFLSTLADLPNPPDSEPRRPLDNVAEDEVAEFEMDETNKRVDSLYT